MALVVAMLYPLPLHCCQGLAHLGSPIGVADAGHCEMPGAMQGDGGCAKCAHHGGSVTTAAAPIHCASIDLGIRSSDAGGCDCVLVAHVAFDSAVPIVTALQLYPPVVPAITVVHPLSLPGLVGEPVFKIGSSPPFMADKSHYTYLSISALLI